MSVPNAITAGQPNEYLRIMDDAWQAHLAPRTPDALTIVSLFSGIGGSSLGYSMAGYRELLAVEWDDHAVACFRLNFPDVPVYHGDIAKLSVDQALEMTNLKPGELDVLDGSPPCQGLSIAGNRILDDPRNGLFREYVRLLQGLQPKAFIMENVSGLVKGKMKLIFAEIMRALKASGYKVSARLMNAMYFHVPQSRERIIFVGIHRDYSYEPNHPVAQIYPPTVHDAFEQLNNTTEELDTPIQWGQNPKWAISRLIPFIRIGGSCDEIHPKGAGFNLVRLDDKRVSPTISKTCNEALFAGLLPPHGNRFCTIPEIKRLASFPDAFQMIGDFKQQWARIGNSVPPLFMRAIAMHLAQLLGREAGESLTAAVQHPMK